MEERNTENVTVVENEVRVHRTYKDRLFRMIFKEKKELMSLYNAMNQTHYTDLSDLEINTLENAVYLNMKNDLSFVIHTELSLYEHQSTYNPNLPIRDLMYVAKVYQGMLKDENLYGETLVKIPAPRFITFYNGVEPQPERQVLRLSDAYEKREDESEIHLELEVLMLNINPGFNNNLVESCKTLRDYMIYTDKVRTYVKTLKLEDAVEKAITECIKDGVLAEFLTKNRAEAKDMSIFEYDEEKHMQQEREEWQKKGENRINQLTRLLLDSDRIDDLKKAATDKDYQEKLLAEFKL